MDDARTMPALDVGDYSEEAARQGARNLLIDAAGLGKGDDLLIINDTEGRIDPEVSRIIEDEARKLGARVHVLWTGPTAEAADIPRAVQAAFETADVTLFHHPMSSQMRMLDIKGGRLVSNFATTRQLLASPLALTPFAYWLELLKLLQERLNGAARWRVTCPDGTDLGGDVGPGYGTKRARPEGQTFSTVSFPPGIFSPFPTATARGRMAVRWLISSGIHYGEETSATLPATVMVDVEDGRFTAFSGDATAVGELKAMLARIGERHGKDPFMINSWHAGMNAACASDRTMDEDLNHWLFVAHSHPRVVHFHAVGAAQPGELSIASLDPTIEIDGEVLWEAGRLAFAEREEVRSALGRLGDPALASCLTAHQP